MSYLAAVLIVVGCAAVAGLASLLIGRRVTVESRRQRHEIGIAVFQQVGVMFAVLLAFVFNEVWTQYNTAAQSINRECGALHGAAMLANAIPNRAGRPVNERIADYGRTVVAVEWPMMAQRRRSPEAAQAFRMALDTAARVPVTERADVAMRSQIVQLLTQAHAERETRTFQISRGVPWAMWTVLILLALILQLFVLFAGLDAPAHALLAAAFGGCTVLALVLVRMLDFPFEGALALSSADFVKTVGEVSEMLAGR